ncbi:MAG: hypothetical protein FWC47_07620 [Oscillospiraceae bacterium]|nr:hypothetical protein [Oscillospiraceae bacterium]
MKFEKKILFTDSINKTEIILKALDDFSMFSEDDLMKDILKEEYFKTIIAKFDFDNEVMEYTITLNNEGKIYCADILEGDITDYGFHLNRDLSYTYAQEKEACTTLFKFALNGYYLDSEEKGEKNLEFEKYGTLSDIKVLKDYLTEEMCESIDSPIFIQIIKSLNEDALTSLSLESDKDIGPFKISFTPNQKAMNEFNFEDCDDGICYYKKPNNLSNLYVLILYDECDKIRYLLFRKGLLMGNSI